MTLSIEQQANRWLVRQSGDGLDAAERAALEAWYAADPRHRGAYIRAQAIHAKLQKAVREAKEGASEQVAAAQAPEVDLSHGPRRGWGLLRGLAIAAAMAAVFVGVSIWNQAPAMSIATAVGEFRRVPLADQSIANINSASVAKVVFTEHLRQVELEKGEAWFEVAKDRSRPFVVSAGEARVRAVGTSFSVQRHAKGAEILVTEGVVEVWRKDADAGKKFVAAGERALVQERGDEILIRQEPDEIARKLAWRDGKLVFVNQTLGEAVGEFNRYTRKQIVLADAALAQRTLTGQYAIDDPERFAHVIGGLLSVPVVVTHDRIILGDIHALNATGAAGRERATPPSY